ncbi:hypothetical protein [Streptomyces sp. NPDC055013]
MVRPDPIRALHRERRGRGRELTVELDKESRVELLQRLAYWLIRQRPRRKDRTDAVHRLERLLPFMPYVAAQSSPEEILRHLLVHSGLLREPAVDAVDFVHRTFQDFLGERAAVEERDFDVLVAHARAEVGRRARELIPPHSRTEAREPAGLGPIVLELLPSPAGLDENLNRLHRGARPGPASRSPPPETGEHIHRTPSQRRRSPRRVSTSSHPPRRTAMSDPQN